MPEIEQVKRAIVDVLRTTDSWSQARLRLRESVEGITGKSISVYSFDNCGPSGCRVDDAVCLTFSIG